ncbi:MAG: DUF1285 domain-containing protein [Alphaproteobacteria bacterium]|nr:DUF1285 domain-containing protein [Alphaproteobacteria bacterium]
MSGLEELIKAAKSAGQAPVERWSPPYFGDIGLSIGRDGRWFYQGSAIGRMALVKLFARVLWRDEDGRHFLVTPAEKVDVTVEDAPFLAVEMEVRGHGEGQQLIFRTNVDDVVACGRDARLRFEMETGGGVKPYVAVRGRLEALVVRSTTYDLLQLAVEYEDRAGIWSGGEFFAIA